MQEQGQVIKCKGYSFSVLNNDQKTIDEVKRRIQSFGDPTSIPDHGFYGIVGLTQITIPPSVTSIGTMAFLGCFNLQKVTIPSSVTSIGNDAFYNCNSLQEIRMSKSLHDAIGPNIRIILGLNFNVRILDLDGRELVSSGTKVPPQVSRPREPR